MDGRVVEGVAGDDPPAEAYFRRASCISVGKMVYRSGTAPRPIFVVICLPQIRSTAAYSDASIVMKASALTEQTVYPLPSSTRPWAAG